MTPTPAVGRDAAAADTGPEQVRDEVAAALRQRDAARRQLRDFVASVSHELRNPLTAILGHADLYAAGVLDDDAKVRQAMASIRGEGDRLVAVLDQLLAEARTHSADGLEAHGEAASLADRGLDGDVAPVGIDD